MSLSVRGGRIATNVDERTLSSHTHTICTDRKKNTHKDRIG